MRARLEPQIAGPLAAKRLELAGVVLVVVGDDAEHFFDVRFAEGPELHLDFELFRLELSEHGGELGVGRGHSGDGFSDIREYGRRRWRRLCADGPGDASGEETTGAANVLGNLAGRPRIFARTGPCRLLLPIGSSEHELRHIGVVRTVDTCADLFECCQERLPLRNETRDSFADVHAVRQR